MAMNMLGLLFLSSLLSLATLHKTVSRACLIDEQNADVVVSSIFFVCLERELAIRRPS
jgi:hypothetical protein